MFDEVFDSMRKATETTIRAQQEMFKKWVGLWPGVPASPTGWVDGVQKFQKRWAETVKELAGKQREAVEAQFNAGLKHIEQSFRLAEVKDLEELHQKTVELWKQVFECLRQTYETQVRDLQNATTKLAELAAPAEATV